MKINKLDDFHKIIFFVISSIVLLANFLFTNLLTYEIQIYILFILVSIIGLPHGFFDFTIGKNIFQKITKNWFLYFSASYLCIAVIYFLLWKSIPTFSLLFFLVISALHFGYEDYNYLTRVEKRKLININIILKGIIVVFTPIFFHYEEVTSLFFILTNYSFKFYEINSFYKITYIIFLVSYIAFEKNKNFLYKFEELMYLINFIFLPPLISFTLYFCFLHSIRHFLESIFIYKYVPENFTTKSFVLTIILTSLIFSIITVFLIERNFDINTNETIIKYVFIMLACLTLPHMIFNMLTSSN